MVRTWVSSNGSDSNPCSRTQPCRNFGPAVVAVDPGGEVVVLDSAGYGPVTVDKPVSLIAPAGIFAAIAPTSGAAMVFHSVISFNGTGLLVNGSATIGGNNISNNVQGINGGGTIQTRGDNTLERNISSMTPTLTLYTTR